MPIIINATPKERSVCAQGTWFTFKPEQIKNIGSESLAFFFTSNLSYEGLVRLSDKFEEPEYKLTPEGKQELQEAKEKGMQARTQFLQGIINNELISLKSDMEKTGDRSDPVAHMSKGMIVHMEELAEYKKKLNDKKKEQVAQIHKLKELIDG